MPSPHFARRSLLAALMALPCARAHAAAPALELAREHHGGLNPALFLVSEKLDGVRAYWSGEQLLFRSGQPIAAPLWFTQALPKVALDGELWLARGRFDALSGMVRKATPNDADWRGITYQVFDLPGAAGGFEQRHEALLALVRQAKAQHFNAVPQERGTTPAALAAKLKAAIAAGGEGLMLHRADALHAPGRSDALFKLKPVQDAEATVLAHVAGQGKHAGKLGALMVQMPSGLQFKLGTGFSDADRANPPPVGSVVTYTYRGSTPSGKPRFAAYLRQRQLP